MCSIVSVRWPELMGYSHLLSNPLGLAAVFRLFVALHCEFYPFSSLRTACWLRIEALVFGLWLLIRARIPNYFLSGALRFLVEKIGRPYFEKPPEVQCFVRLPRYQSFS